MNHKAIIITCALFLAQCQPGEQTPEEQQQAQGESHSEEQHKKHQHDKAHHLETVHLTADKLETVGLSYDTLRTMNLSEALKTNGHVHLAPNHQSMISSLINGRVKRINVIEGDYVKEGETLALLEGMAITELQQEYLQNKAELPYLEKEYKRKKKLQDERVGAASELQKAKAEYESALAKMKGKEEKLKMLGIFDRVKDGNISSTVPINAPFEGHIGDVQITKGQFLEPQQPLIEVLNTNKAHLELQVYEKNIGRVKEGQTVLYKYANQQQDWLRGQVFRVGKKYHKENQSIRVHAHIHNPAEIEIIPGVYVTARIQASTGQGFALPEEAVIRDGKKTFVFAPVTELLGALDHLEEAPGAKKKFVRIPVVTGATDGGFTSIRSFKQDVPKDIRFVTKGASELQAEMKKGVGGHHH